MKKHAAPIIIGISVALFLRVVAPERSFNDWQWWVALIGLNGLPWLLVVLDRDRWFK